MNWLLNHSPFAAQSTALEQVEHEPHGFAYFMEMGLGKTAVLLAEWLRLYRDGKVDQLVVICPNSLKTNWAREVVKWFPNDGSGFTVEIWPKVRNPHIVIMNYEALSGGTRKGLTLLQGICENKKVMVALDESTQIKNHQSVRTKALLSVARSATFTRILSGCPSIQGPQDLWSQLKFIGDFKGVNFFQYRNRYCRMGGYMGRKITGPNPQNLEELTEIIGRNSFRARKMDWLDIPPKVYHTREIELSAEQMKHYRNMLKEFITLIENEEIDAPMVITQMGKLQQISSNFLYGEDGKAMVISKSNNKLHEIRSIMDEVEGKIILVTVYSHSTKLLLEEFKDEGVVGIYGGMKDAEIDEAKRQFNEGDARIIVCQSSAAKYGHTLLGTEDMPCSTTIFYENSFSLDDRVQIEDRNHRIGQKHTVNIIDIVTSGIERKVIEALQQKQNIAEAIIDAVKVQRI